MKKMFKKIIRKFAEYYTRQNTEEEAANMTADLYLFFR